LRPEDFKSPAYAIPPPGQTLLAHGEVPAAAQLRFASAEHDEIIAAPRFVRRSRYGIGCGHDVEPAVANCRHQRCDVIIVACSFDDVQHSHVRGSPARETPCHAQRRTVQRAIEVGHEHTLPGSFMTLHAHDHIECCCSRDALDHIREMTATARTPRITQHERIGVRLMHAAQHRRYPLRTVSRSNVRRVERSRSHGAFDTDRQHEQVELAIPRHTTAGQLVKVLRRQIAGQRQDAVAHR
jgi:hypothetical protein